MTSEVGRILILEDNRDRRYAMRQCLQAGLPAWEAVFFATPQPMLSYLRDDVSTTACISLDHDMDLIEDAEGRLIDPGTGREIADFLAGRQPQCPVILHTTNSRAADGMEAVLSEAGWTVHRVSPYGDLDWVGEL